MEVDRNYKVKKRIKIHTKPLVTCDVTLSGRFEKETKSYLIFDNFRVKKDVVISIKKL